MLPELVRVRPCVSPPVKFELLPFPPWTTTCSPPSVEELGVAVMTALEVNSVGLTGDAPIQ